MQKKYITYHELDIGSQGINLLVVSVLAFKHYCSVGEQNIKHPWINEKDRGGLRLASSKKHLLLYKNASSAEQHVWGIIKKAMHWDYHWCLVKA